VPVYGGRYGLGGRLSGEALLAGLQADGGMGTLVSGLSGEAVLAGVTAGGGMALQISTNTVLVGDSLTAYSYGEIHTATGINALAGAPLKVIKNIGVSGDTVQHILDRIHNSHTASLPGLAGLGVVGWAILRVGTNDTRGGSSINSTVQTAYQNLISALLTYVQRVIVMAVPPCGPNNGGNGSGVNSYNSWLSSYCTGLANVSFIDDTTTVNNGSGGWATGYEPADGIHYDGIAANRMTLDGAAAFAALVSPYGYPNPLITDPADVYPTTAQWIDHPMMDGTGGTNTIGSGSVPTGWTVTAYGSGLSATSDIVAADIDDPVNVPWLRVTPTAVAVASGAYLYITAGMSGRSITDSDPEALELVVQIRFNEFDGTKFTRLLAYVYGIGNEVMTPRPVYFLGDSAENHVIVLRTACSRPNIKVSSADSYLSIELVAVTAYTGAMGSFDIRRASARG
jgi:lysophospholipase L1-like esterase